MWNKKKERKREQLDLFLRMDTSKNFAWIYLCVYVFLQDEFLRKSKDKFNQNVFWFQMLNSYCL